MNFKPILFNTEMVKAILKSEKTQTRREVKVKKDIKDYEVGFTFFCDKGDFGVRGIHENGEFGESFFKLPIATGDILWVRETFKYWGVKDGYIYRADINDSIFSNCLGWRPSIHMPKEAARIFLEVTKVRIDRLKNINRKDALAEGVDDTFDTAEGAFLSLWSSIYGKESLADNPYVFIIEFKQIDKPEEFNNQ
jgi:hypothetical protein